MPAPLTLVPDPQPPAPTAPAGQEPFITSEELAAWLRIGESTLRQWRKRGIAPPHDELPSGAIRYRPSVVLAWIAASARTAA